MNKYAKQWVAALRSGEYKQGFNTLHSITDEGERFCCLGVACDLFRDELSLTKKQEQDVYMYNGDDATLPLSVVSLLNLNGENAYWGTNVEDNDKSLVAWNDVKKKSFKQIAALIEREPKGMFRDGSN